MNLVTQSTYNFHTGATWLQPKHQQYQQQMTGTVTLGLSVQLSSVQDDISTLGQAHITN